MIKSCLIQLKGTANILSLVLVQKHHLVTYNSRYGNESVVHIPQQPKINTNKDGIFYYGTGHLIKSNNNEHIMVNNSHFTITQVQEKKKHYTICDLKRDNCARLSQHITRQPVKQMLHTVDNNNLQNLPILQEDVRMVEDIYGPSVTY